MPLKHPIFKHIMNTVDRMGLEAYVIGGYVRDHYLRRPSTDVDVVVVGSGVAVAEELGRELGAKVTIYKTYGTAMLHWRDTEVEFVGARRESYTPESRNPQVEPGTLEDDQRRRDFTINAICLNDKHDILDYFDGQKDLEDKIIRCVGNPKERFYEDALRIMRAIRFSATLNFEIHPDTEKAIFYCRDLLNIQSLFFQ